MIPFFLKILTPKVLKHIMKYVFEKNDLHYKVDGLTESLVDDIDNINKELKKRNKK